MIGPVRSAARRFGSPLTRRILAVNILALAIPIAGLLYLGEYRRGLVEGELAALSVQGAMFAAALGEGAVNSDAGGLGLIEQALDADSTRSIVRRLAETTGTRARVYNAEGVLIVDSRRLIGPGGTVQIEPVAPPLESLPVGAWMLSVLGRVLDWLPGHQEFPLYEEKVDQQASDYDEVALALDGEPVARARSVGDGRLILGVGQPVQSYKQVLGALLLTKGSPDIEAAMAGVRLTILQVFAVGLGVTILLSLYLAGTIARPIRRLALAAERVRLGRGREAAIPDFAGRRDEIGELARSLRAMTEALTQRVDAIEAFAADVAHEIKNPLTSVKSAVETVVRLKDPEQQQRLFAIILDDVDRLNRLISDIADASRLDAELSRARPEPVDLRPLLATLVDVQQTPRKSRDPALHFDIANGLRLDVEGVESRLVQVFRNLIANAASFSPPDGSITLRAARDRDAVVVTVEDEGPGIPSGKERAIFDRFYSERPAGEKFGAHSGLGLSISQQIVDAHGGTISAENRVAPDGRVLGARFTVRLPARTPGRA